MHQMFRLPAGLSAGFSGVAVTSSPGFSLGPGVDHSYALETRRVLPCRLLSVGGCLRIAWLGR